jgi:hypothetical protein
LYFTIRTMGTIRVGIKAKGITKSPEAKERKEKHE